MSAAENDLRHTPIRTAVVATVAFVLAAAGLSTPAVAETAQPAFDDVYPTLLLRCTRCHGARLQDADLDLRTRESMLRGGESGPAIVPGSSNKSLLIGRLRAGEMPPPKRLVEASVTEISRSEIDQLARWIDAGAPLGNLEPVHDDSAISDEERQFWAFQPPVQPAVPSVPSDESIVNPIDAFVWRKLHENDLGFSPTADRLTLIRRVTFDLTGLPPTPEEAQSFLSDPEPDAYGKLIDRLLASPRFGERQARSWLDLAGYEDQRQAFRYRDYVIRAASSDKSYDRFLLEQIAGDELFDYEEAPSVTQEMVDAVVATGFLRMTPDTTSNRLTNFVSHRERVIADELDVFSSVVLGLTLQCARCHDHKFDPISQTEYFRLVDVFRGAYDPYDWLLPIYIEDPNAPMLQMGERFLPYRKPGLDVAAAAEEEKRRNAHNEELDVQLKELQEALEKIAAPMKKRHLDDRIAGLPEVVREKVRDALTTDEKERTEEQKQIAYEYRFVPLVFGSLAEYDPNYKKLAEPLERRIALLKAEKIPAPRIRALWDRGRPSPTYLLRRGDAMSLGPRVAPGVPAVLSTRGAEFNVSPRFPGAKKTGRRLALARWLTQRDHPLTARVVVNRVWQHHFGRAIVTSLSNFGRSGVEPTHPDLLDWLAVRLVKEGWSLKALRKLIVTSRTYRQASSLKEEHELHDPDNRYLSRMVMRRLSAEEINDTLAFVSGRLDERRYGSPDPRLERPDGLVTVYERDSGYRRSIYVRQTRVRNLTTLDLFDFPQLTPNCVERTVSTVAPQALHLMNDSTIRRLARAFAERVRREAGDDPRDQVEQVYRLALSRPPQPQERTLALATLARLQSDSTLTEAAVGGTLATSPDGLVTLCHVILNSAALLYID